MQHKSAFSQLPEMFKETIFMLDEELLPHLPKVPALPPSDYNLSSSVRHELANQHIKAFKNIQIWIFKWVSVRVETFFWDGFIKCV